MTILRTYPRRGLHGQVVHEIGARIVRGELAPGDPLPGEDELARSFGGSRTVLREAVKVLAAKGLVEARPRTGTRVRPRRDWNLLDPDVLAWRLEGEPDASFFRDLAELRQVVEPAAARVAAERAPADVVERMAVSFAEMEAALDDVEAYIEADVRFHAAFLESCGNELLEQLGSTLREVFRASRTLTTSVPGSSRRTLPLHRRVADAIGAHDARGAERATAKLLATTATDVERALAQRAGV
jgi:GntR family galactonate operon transcriptional repressor